MARLTALPSLEIIRGLKGIIDFYLWKGLPCARAWPRWRPARQTAASLAAALVFGAIVKSYNVLGDLPLEAYREDALDQPRTARDIMVTGAYGNLHEASMSDFLDLLVECRDFLSALTALLGALDSIDTDELVVNVDQTVLPPLAATSTIQTTQLTALQKLDDLQDALQSKGLDRLIVRGEDQLHSFKEHLRNRRTAVISGANGYTESAGPGAGVVWVVTNIACSDRTSPSTAHGRMIQDDALAVLFSGEVAAFGAGVSSYWSGHLYLEEGDVVRVFFDGALAGDDCRVELTGYQMTKET